MQKVVRKVTFADVVVAILFLVSPVAGIYFRTLRAIYFDYYTGLINDPGHRWVATFNKILVILVAAGTAILYNLNRDNPSNWISYFSDDVFLNMAFAQTAGWPSFFILYALSAMLYFYGKYRDVLIRKINENAKVW